VIAIRKVVVLVEETFHEGGVPATQPLAIGTAAAVVKNPYAGRYEPNVMPFMAELRDVGAMLSRRLIAALGGADKIEAYGKGAIVGEDGELEHGALWHEAGGWSLRAALGERKAIVPAAKTVGALGARLMIPLGHTRAAYVRSHFNSADLTVWDAPRRGEIVFGLCAATGARIHARCGGLAAADIKGEDGQR
jgi:hypothetical protein